MNSLFDDLKQGLEEAIDLQKSVGIAKTDMNMPIRKYSKEEIREIASLTEIKK